MHRFFNNKKAQTARAIPLKPPTDVDVLGNKLNELSKKAGDKLNEGLSSASKKSKEAVKYATTFDKEKSDEQLRAVGEASKKMIGTAGAAIKTGAGKTAAAAGAVGAGALVLGGAIVSSVTVNWFGLLAIVAYIIDLVAGLKVLSIHFTAYLLLGLLGIIFGVFSAKIEDEKGVQRTNYMLLFFGLQTFVPLLIMYPITIYTINLSSMAAATLTFTPFIILYWLWHKKFLGGLSKLYVIAIALLIITPYLILPATNISIKEIGNIPTTDYSPTKAYTYMKNFIVGGYTGTTKYFSNLIYYAEHGEYPGETADTEKPNIMKLTDPITPNKLDYAEGEPIAISAFFASSNENTIKVFFSCYHVKASCSKGCTPTRDTNVEPSFVKNRYVGEAVTCYPDLSASLGQNKVMIFAKGTDLNTSATLTNYFTSQESLNTQLNRYFANTMNSALATGIIDTEEKRISALRDIYKINEQIVSVSDSGNVKLILYTKQDPIIGVNTELKDSILSLVVVFENVAEGQIDAIDSLNVKIPEGMVPVKEKCTDFEFDNRNSISAKKMDPKTVATRLNFTKMPQVALLPCVLQITNPDALLANGPNLATPATFTGAITYNYTVKKEFDVKYGEEQPGDIGVSGTVNAACPAVDGISGYSQTAPGSAEAKLVEYDDYINKYAAEQGVCAALIKGVITQESQGNPNAVSSNGARGLMQIMPENAAGCGITSDDLFDPEKNIKCGTRYLRGRLDAFNGNVENAVASYNAGVAGVKNPCCGSDSCSCTKSFSDFKSELSKETQAYVSLVLGYAKYYSAKSTTIAAGSGQCTGDLVDVGGGLKLRKSAADQWESAKNLLNQRGIDYYIVSTSRSEEKAMELYLCWKNNVPGCNAACGPIGDENNPASYSHCPHVQGCAIDIHPKIDTPAAYQRVQNAMYDSGWVRWNSEAWHFEYGTNGWLAGKDKSPPVYS